MATQPAGPSPGIERGGKGGGGASLAHCAPHLRGRPDCTPAAARSGIKVCFIISNFLKKAAKHLSRHRSEKSSPLFSFQLLLGYY